MLKYRRRFALVPALLLLLLSGCTPPEVQTPTTVPSLQETFPGTEPTEGITEEPTVLPTEPSEPLPDAELFTEDGVLPLLIGAFPEDYVGENASEEKPSSITVNYTAWDLQEGKLVSPVPWYRQEIDSWLETNIRFWAGSTHVIGTGYREPLVQGLTQRASSLGNAYFGTVIMATSLPGYARLYWISPEGNNAGADISQSAKRPLQGRLSPARRSSIRLERW